MAFNFPKLSSSGWLLTSLLLLALVLRVGVFVQFPSLIHPDEVFQTLEPAHRLAYGWGVTTWEWRQGIRSWVLPAILAALMRATEWMGAGSSGYRIGIAIALSLLSLTAVWFAFNCAKRLGGMPAAIIGGVTAAIWYDLVYYSPRTLNEVVAAHVLLPGLYLGMFAGQVFERRRIFWAGILCGLALSLRIQLIPAVAFAGFYFCRSNWRLRLPAFSAGLVLPVLAFGLVDAFTWSYPFQSFVQYFWVNVIERKSLVYGTQPWYWYGIILAIHFGPVLLFALAGVRRSPFLGGMVLIILASHSVLAHKEVRFLYPLFPLVLTLGALGVVEVAEALKTFWSWTIRPSGAIAVGVLLFGSTSVVFGSLAVFREYWTRNSGGLIALDQISRSPEACGVALSGVPWYETGGYAHLHHRVPLLLMRRASAVTKHLESSFNFAVSDGFLPYRTSFELKGCWNGVCLYERPGSCTPPATNEINDVLLQEHK